MAARIDSSLAGPMMMQSAQTAAPVQRHDDPAFDEGLVEDANDDGKSGTARQRLLPELGPKPQLRAFHVK